MSERADGGRVPGHAALRSTTLEEVASAVRDVRWLTDRARPRLGDQPPEIGSTLGDHAPTWLGSGVAASTRSGVAPTCLAGPRARSADDLRGDLHGLDVVHDAVPALGRSVLAVARVPGGAASRGGRTDT